MVGFSYAFSAVYEYEKAMNINEVMFILTYNGNNLEVNDISNFLIYLGIIGKIFKKYDLEMLELDPRNLYQNLNHEIKVGSCLKIFPPGVKIHQLPELYSDNLTYFWLTQSP